MAGEKTRRIEKRGRDPHLFRPLELRSVTLSNRIGVSPMCQYSADDGVANDWHLSHLGGLATGGPGLLFTEATAVEPRGRITPHCLGLWNDEQRDAIARIVGFVEEQGAVPGIQLAHAGRKASITQPWEGDAPLKPEDGGWQPIGPTSEAFSEAHNAPEAMDQAAIAEAVAAFGAAAGRAREAGFKVIEIHGAHGYLINSFLSPLANRREDDYGGSFENRARLLLEVIGAVRAEWPKTLPLFVRISASDWVEGGWNLDDSVALARMLEATGDVDLIDCSSGGVVPGVKIKPYPGYQVPFAEAIKRGSGLMSACVGLIHAPEMAEEIIANGRADLVLLGRSILHNPHWPLHAASLLKATDARWPVQYERANIF
ncbi:MAG: NADH:flavin oxidoreductase/NADH oxidase [Alphaproteobacteria bacterium]